MVVKEFRVSMENKKGTVEEEKRAHKQNKWAHILYQGVDPSASRYRKNYNKSSECVEVIMGRWIKAPISWF